MTSHKRTRDVLKISHRNPQNCSNLRPLKVEEANLKCPKLMSIKQIHGHHDDINQCSGYPGEEAKKYRRCF